MRNIFNTRNIFAISHRDEELKISVSMTSGKTGYNAPTIHMEPNIKLYPVLMDNTRHSTTRNMLTTETLVDKTEEFAKPSHSFLVAVVCYCFCFVENRVSSLF